MGARSTLDTTSPLATSSSPLAPTVRPSTRLSSDGPRTCPPEHFPPSVSPPRPVPPSVRLTLTLSTTPAPATPTPGSLALCPRLWSATRSALLQVPSTLSSPLTPPCCRCLHAH